MCRALKEKQEQQDLLVPTGNRYWDYCITHVPALKSETCLLETHYTYLHGTPSILRVSEDNQASQDHLYVNAPASLWHIALLESVQRLSMLLCLSLGSTRSCRQDWKGRPVWAQRWKSEYKTRIKLFQSFFLASKVILSLYWKFPLSKGNDGAQGSQGSTGPPGSPGTPGLMVQVFYITVYWPIFELTILICTLLSVIFFLHWKGPPGIEGLDGKDGKTGLRVSYMSVMLAYTEEHPNTPCSKPKMRIVKEMHIIVDLWHWLFFVVRERWALQALQDQEESLWVSPLTLTWNDLILYQCRIYNNMN